MQKVKNNIISPYIKEFMTTEQTTKTFELTIGERQRALMVLNTMRVNVETYGYVLEDGKVLAISEEEWQKAGLVRKVTNPEAPKEEQKENWSWNEPDEQKKCELHSASIDFLVKYTKEKSDANDIGLDEGPLVTLYQKLIA